MPKLLLSCALTIAALGGTLGCASNSGIAKLGGGPANGVQRLPLTAEKPGTSARMVAMLTDNPVTRGVSSAVEKGTNWIKPDPKHEDVPDRISLANKSPAPTAEWHVAMAGVQEKLGKQQLAVSQYEKALELDPRHLGALLGLAHHHDRYGRMEQATKVYQQAAKHHPKNAAVLNDMGLCYARRGMYDASIQSLEQAVGQNPQRKLYRNNLAKVLIQVGRTDQAMQHLVAVHGNAAGHYNMGYLLSLLGDQQGATQQFQWALQIDPSLEQAKTWLAQHPPQANPSQGNPLPGNAIAVAQRDNRLPAAGTPRAPQAATSLRSPPVAAASRPLDRYAVPQPGASSLSAENGRTPSPPRYRVLQIPEVGATARFVSQQETPPSPGNTERYEPSTDQPPETPRRF